MFRTLTRQPITVPVASLRIAKAEYDVCQTPQAGNITMAPAYETLRVCTKASSPVNARNDRHHARPWDMPRLPHAGTISPSGLRGILPCPSFKCAHVDTRACTKNIPEKMLQKTIRPSWAQLVWASEVVRAEDFSDRCFCSHRAVGYVPRSPRFPAQRWRNCTYFFVVTVL